MKGTGHGLMRDAYGGPGWEECSGFLSPFLAAVFWG